MKLQAMILFAAALSHPFAAMARNNDGATPDTRLRGRLNYNDKDELQQRRALLELNDMACVESSAQDGSIFCTFHAMTPFNTNGGTIISECLKVSGSELCLAANISMESLVVPGDVSAIHVIGRDKA